MTYLDINFILLMRVHCNKLKVGKKAESSTLTAAVVFVGFDLTKVPKSLDFTRNRSILVNGCRRGSYSVVEW